MLYFNRLEIIGFMNLKSILFLYFYYLNMDISINIRVMDLRASPELVGPVVEMSVYFSISIIYVYP